MLMTKEEVASIVKYCSENGVSHKSRLAELGISQWRLYKSKKLYEKDQATYGSHFEKQPPRIFLVVNNHSITIFAIRIR